MVNFRGWETGLLNSVYRSQSPGQQHHQEGGYPAPALPLDLPAIVQTARLAGSALMVNAVAELAEFASTHENTVVHPNRLKSFTLRAEGHYFAGPGFGKLLFFNVPCPLS
jgi:hypothetical protein